MATMITDECINCGACEPECPNTAIYQGGVEWEFNGEMHPALSEDLYYIVPEKCTECVGFYEQEACAAVCPVDCCLPNPEIVETEDRLLARAKELHPEQSFEADFPSRFRGDGAKTPAPAEATPEPATDTPEPAAEAAVAPQPTAAPPSQITATSPRPARPKPVTVTPQRPVEEQIYPGELAGTFEQALARVQPKRRGVGLGTLISIAQPILGALPLSTKRALEEAVGDKRYFSVATSTSLNALMNMLLYPTLLVVLYTARGGSLFSQAINGWISLGLILASAEMLIRLREAFFAGVPTADATFRGTVYGLALAPLISPLLSLVGKRRSLDAGAILQDGYFTREFDEKAERARRYGEIYAVEDIGDAYLLRLELPQRVPISAAKREMEIGDEMPDYDLDLSLKDGSFFVKGSVTEPNVRKLTAISAAFPSEFIKCIEVHSAVASFKHRYQQKLLEVVLFKR